MKKVFFFQIRNFIFGGCTVLVLRSDTFIMHVRGKSGAGLEKRQFSSNAPRNVIILRNSIKLFSFRRQSLAPAGLWFTGEDFYSFQKPTNPPLELPASRTD